MANKRGMMDQFWDIKNEHPDTVLFFRMGDFYELFHEDAVIGSQTLGLSLTSRDKNAENPIKMAGFPWHAIEDHLKTMLAAGYKVTVCEQEENLRPGAKLLERVVTRVYTPGSLYEESLIGTDQSALLCSIVKKNNIVGMAFFDASTSRADACEVSVNDNWEKVTDLLMSMNPSELIFSEKLSQDAKFRHCISHLEKTIFSQHNSQQKVVEKSLKELLKVSDLGHIDLNESEVATHAIALAAHYLSKMHQMTEIPLNKISIINNHQYMTIDRTTLANLQLIHAHSGEKEGSLFGSIDKCRTAMGRRKLKQWILNPLMDIDEIVLRQNSIKSLTKSSRRLAGIRDMFLGLRDMERLSTQLAYGRAGGRELYAIGEALSRMPGLKVLACETKNEMLTDLCEDIDSLDYLRVEILSTLQPSQPLSVKEGGLIAIGVNSELDTLRKQSNHGEEMFKNLEAELRNSLNIPSLKVRYNRQIGWYIEVTKTHLEKVPKEWIRKQQMTNGSRYITDELKQWEDNLLNSKTKANLLEYEIFKDLREKCKQKCQQLNNISDSVATVDVLQGLAEIARKRAWVCPTITNEYNLSIQDAKHPVLGQDTGFVPNHVDFSKKRKFLLITGPNMGGKSTYLRTTALITILAQLGSFVPASKAKIGLVDRIFTRVGASDDMLKGRSTFMVEMVEVAHILQTATPKSLILLDEVGRGTSTFDGLSIAWSVTEDICQRLQSRTLFATHYHQLIGLEGAIQGLVNVSVQVAVISGELKFLHTVIDGPCDDSYGVQVASMAGLPRHVVERASDLLIFLERQAEGAKAGNGKTPNKRDVNQHSIFQFLAAQPMTTKENEIEKMIKELDIDSLSPRDAQETLYKLKGFIESDNFD